MESWQLHPSRLNRQWVTLIARLSATGRTLESEPKAPQLRHDVPVTDFSGTMLVNEGEQRDGIARTAADLPVILGKARANGASERSPEIVDRPPRLSQID
jgi:hypothetical protein